MGDDGAGAQRVDTVSPSEVERMGRAVASGILLMLRRTRERDPALTAEQAQAVVMRWLQEHGGLFGDIEATARYMVGRGKGPIGLDGGRLPP